MASKALQRSKHDPPVDVPNVIKANLKDLDSLLDQPPIPGPKPWTDELERAAIYHAANATPPIVALTSVGLSPSAAKDYLSDDPPETYKSACTALRDRLKNASSWCERALLARIADAGTEHRFWQANAWILERSKAFSHQYVAVQDTTATGPATVVNIGVLNVLNTETPRISWRDDPQSLLPDVAVDVVEKG